MWRIQIPFDRPPQKWIKRWPELAKENYKAVNIQSIYTPSFKLSKDVKDALADFVSSEGDVHGIVQDVHGPVADVFITYGLPTKDHGSIRFQINGEIHFAHGRAGWLDESGWWTNRTLLGVQSADGSFQKATDSKITGDQTIQATIDGTRYAWTRDSRLHWTIGAVETAAPTNTPAVALATPSGGVASAQTAPVTSDRPGEYTTPRPSNAALFKSNCESVNVMSVYDDGKVLELDDGRHLRVNDVDSVTSSVWIAPLEGLICDNGDKFINKDDNESVELQP